MVKCNMCFSKNVNVQINITSCYRPFRFFEKYIAVSLMLGGGGGGNVKITACLLFDM